MFLKNIQISIGVSKFRLWENFGSFGRFWQIWADFAALVVANSMPKLRLKS
jgi:hypothetical protein